MTPEQAKALREPFPAEVIGKLPRIWCRDCSDAAKQGRTCANHQKQKCAECGNTITTAHLHLDYVGHAATTDRLLVIDPEFSWEPFSLDDHGLPALDRDGNLWIKLTVCGVTRPGVGDGKNMKERIGDAIRNAAMRFGVALDLWAKEDLHAAEDSDDRPKPKVAPAAKPKPTPKPPAAPAAVEPAEDAPPTEEYVKATKAMWATISELVDAGGVADDIKTALYAFYGVSSTKQLTLGEVRQATADLKRQLAERKKAA